MVSAGVAITDVLTRVLVHLASWFPEEHFGGVAATTFFDEFVAARYAWHRALASPEGRDMAGSIAGIVAAQGALSDAAEAVEQMVLSLLEGREGFDATTWGIKWKAAFTDDDRAGPDLPAE